VSEVKADWHPLVLLLIWLLRRLKTAAVTTAAAVHFAASIDALMNHSTLDAASRHVIAQIRAALHLYLVGTVHRTATKFPAPCMVRGSGLATCSGLLKINWVSIEHVTCCTSVFSN